MSGLVQSDVAASRSDLRSRLSGLSVAPFPTFSTAAAAWFEDHKRYIKPNTADSYGDALGPLSRFFGDKPINEVENIHLHMYQDLGVLQQVLREFGEWKRIKSATEQLEMRRPHRKSGHWS